MITVMLLITINRNHLKIQFCYNIDVYSLLCTNSLSFYGVGLLKFKTHAIRPYIGFIIYTKIGILYTDIC